MYAPLAPAIDRGFPRPQLAHRLPKIDALESIRTGTGWAFYQKPDEWSAKLYAAQHLEACALFANWASSVQKDNPGTFIESQRGDDERKAPHLL